jgi:nucleotide-binding universal stress UspA family protein
MARTVVVGYDGSEIGRAALAAAARRAGDGGRLVVASVAAVPREFVGTPYLEHALHHARERADSLDPEIANSAPGVEVERMIVEGPAAAALAQLAREIDADEIAIGSRGFGAFRTATLGSTSHALLHEVDRPLLIVTRRAVEREGRRSAAAGRTAQPRPVVVGYDGSDFARVALENARERARGTGAPLVAVYAYDAPPDWLGRPYYQRALDDRQARGRELLDDLMERLGSEDGIETDLVEGSPAEALVRAAQARDAEEIVVGSRGLGGIRAAIGSVSYALLHEADCPVVVVPEPEDA